MIIKEQGYLGECDSCGIYGDSWMIEIGLYDTKKFIILCDECMEVLKG